MSKDQTTQKFIVRLFKFKSGEEIVACVHNVIENPHDATYSVLEPVSIHINPEQQQTLTFVTWCMFALERSFSIKSSDLLFKPMEIDPQIVVEYHKRFFLTEEAPKSNILQLPDNQIILKP